MNHIRQFFHQSTANRMRFSALLTKIIRRNGLVCKWLFWCRCVPNKVVGIFYKDGRHRLDSRSPDQSSATQVVIGVVSYIKSTIDTQTGQYEYGISEY